MLDQWARCIGTALELESSAKLAECFPTDLRNGNIAVLQNILWQADAKATISEFSPDWEWPALVLFSRQYLWWCYYVNPAQAQDAEAAMQRAFGALQTAFSRNDGSLLNDTVVNFVSQFGNQLWVASPLLRIFNNIQSEREPITPKQDILLFVSNRLCRIYYSTNQISLCSTVFRSLEHKSLSKYPISQQVELKYSQGRYAMIQGQVGSAFKKLQWAYNNCIDGPNKAKLLDQLLLPGILSGRMPSNKTLQSLAQISPELQKSITLMCIAIRQVKFGAYLEALETPWIKHHRYGNLVRCQMPVLILRRAIKRLYDIKGKPRALSIEDIRKALIITGFFESDDNFLATESVCIALIDSKTMFANLLPGAAPNETRLAMRPNNPIPAYST